MGTQYRATLGPESSAFFRSTHRVIQEPRVVQEHFVNSPFQREKVLLALAEISPYDFPVLYYKKESELTVGIDRRYSAEMKQVRRLCWQRLSFIQKILTMVPFLL